MFTIFSQQILNDKLLVQMRSNKSICYENIVNIALFYKKLIMEPIQPYNNIMLVDDAKNQQLSSLS